ncbi:hypothetical protein TNIN_27151 [Trichonephila inaurata madagascariensis]|uniref:Uncharacterized protein n=1 Tax=Trichonephila inaurata madagascariensis TaxID=2747483 RepID=A0A8X6IBZ4_9ARAC|nr:hypothetical protein TNIN_27151 [Trichonephila inaurata madagascariensis]
MCARADSTLNLSKGYSSFQKALQVMAENMTQKLQLIHETKSIMAGFGDVILFRINGMRRATNTTVVLKDAELWTTGMFRCEVLADAPSFHTVTAEAFMHIGEIKGMLISTTALIQNDHEERRHGLAHAMWYWMIVISHFRLGLNNILAQLVDTT